MKLLICILLLVFSQVETIMAQTDAQNHKKYWYYRYKLRHYFLKAGEGDYPCVDPDISGLTTGHSIPAAFFNDVVVHWGDATADLGWYIGTLATEYRLLKNQSLPTSYTEEELYYALKAYERVDSHAEKNMWPFDNDCTLNGYFGRDDISTNFASQISTFTANKQTVSDYSGHSITTLSPNPPVIKDFEAKNTAVLSQDQMVNLMMGFALVVKCVDANATYKGLNLVSAAKKYNDLFIGRLASAGYTVKIPFTTHYADHGLTDVLPQSYGIARAAQKVQSGDWGGELTSTGKYENLVSARFRNYWETLATPTGLTELDAQYHLHEYQTAFIQNIAALGHSWRIGLEPVVVFHKEVSIPYICGKIYNPKICYTTISVNIWCYLTPKNAIPGLPNLPLICSPVELPSITVDITGPTLSLTGLRYKQEYYPLLHQYLHNGVNPFISKASYKSFINSAPCQGPYFYGSGTGVSGWRANNNRWTKPSEGSNGTSVPDFYGDYSGFDYMLLYNLNALQNGLAVAYDNQLHKDISGTYPQGSTHFGSDANQATFNAFESINISGTLNSGNSANTNGNLTLHAPEGVNVTNFNTSNGATLTILSTPFTCNSSGTGYQIAAPTIPAEEPKVDTAELTKQYNEYVAKELNAEIQKQLPEIYKKVDQARYEPVDDYVKRIESQTKNDQAYIYPNPTNGICQLEFRIYNESAVDFSIVDLYGKEVLKPLMGKMFTAGRHQLSFDVSTLSEGTYLYKLKTDQIMQTGKFVKVNH